LRIVIFSLICSAFTIASQLKRDATPQVYERFAHLCRQYLEKRAFACFFMPAVVVFFKRSCFGRPFQTTSNAVVFAGTGDDASRQVVSKQLLSLLTLRYCASMCVLLQKTSLFAVATIDWYHLLNL
jgi:hypothetical protein